MNKNMGGAFVVLWTVSFAIAALLLFGCGGKAARYPRGAVADGVRYYADYAEARGIPRGVVELSAQEMVGREYHYRFEYDGGKLVSVTFANSAGAPVSHGSHTYIGRASIMEFEYDTLGGLVRTVLKDDHRKPIIAYHWDAADHSAADLKNAETGAGVSLGGAVTSMASDMFKHIGKDWEIGRFEFTYDERGYLTRKVFVRADGDARAADTDSPDTAATRLAEDSRFNGIAGFEYVRDSLGLLAELRYLGKDGLRAPDRAGVAGRAFEFNDQGRIVKITYLGKDGKAVLNEYGWAANVRETDAAGNIVSSSFIGPDGKPILTKGGYALVASIFDDRGNVIKKTYYGTGGEPVLILPGGGHTIAGYAMVTSKYDERGNAIENEYFGTDGKPILRDGFVKKTSKYDDNGRPTEEAYFGIDGKPVLHKKNNLAKITVKYDYRGNRIEERYFGTDGKLMLLPGAGYAIFTSKYDERGNLIEEAFFGIDGEPVISENRRHHKLAVKYDERGNDVEDEYYDTDGQLMRDVSRAIREHNDKGEKIFEIIYDINGRPVFGGAEVFGDVELLPDNAVTRNKRGNAYRIAYPHSYYTAAEDYMRAIELDSTYATPHRGLGGTYYVVNRYYARRIDVEIDDIISYFDRAIELDSNYAHAYADRALVYVETGEFDKALADAETATRLAPNLCAPHYIRALVNINKGDYDMAIENLDTALQLKDGHAHYHDRSLVQQRTDMLYHYTRAIARAFKGDDEAAEEWRDRRVNHRYGIDYYSGIISKRPDDALARYHRGTLYLLDGNYAEEAVKDLEHALQLLPDHALAKKRLEEAAQKR